MKTPSSIRRSLNLVLAGSIATVLSVSSAHAANFTWSATPGSANWADGSNWGGTAPSTGSTLTFAASSVSALNNNLTDSSFVVNSLTFNSGSPAYVISGNAFTLGTATGATVISNNSTSLQTINSNITLGNAGQTISLKAGGGDVTLGGTITGGASTSLSTSGVGTLTIKGSTTVSQFNVATTTTVKVDGGSLTGVWNLAGSGTVQVTNSGTFTATGVYDANHYVVQDSGLVTLGAIAGNNIKRVFLTTTGGTSTIVGTINLGLNLDAGGSAVVNYQQKANLVDYSANGNLTVGGNASVTAAAGLDLAATGATVTGAGTVNLNGGTLALGGVGLVKTNQTTSTSVVNFNGGKLKYNAATTGTAMANTTFNVLAGGAVIDTQANAVTIGQAFLSGVTGDGGLTKQGSGNLILGGVNTYTGATMVSSGTLSLASAGSINNSSAINIASGAVFDVTSKTSGYHIVSGQALKGSGNINIGAGKTITVDSGAHWAPGNSIGQNSVTGNLTLAAGSSTDVELGTASASKTAANSATTNDKTTVSGALTLGGTLHLFNNSNANGQGSAGAGSYLIFAGASSVSGSFGSIVNVAGFHAAVDSISTTGNVYVDLNYYADAAFSKVSGEGELTGNGTNYTLSLGNAGKESGLFTVTISLDNVLHDLVYQDLLSGGFDISGAGDFSLTGFSASIASIASGAGTTLTVTFDTGGADLGWYYGTVVFHPTSANASGTAALSDVTLGMEFEVTAVPEPATWSMIAGGLGMLALAQRARRRMSR